jgi:hypothetical protein
VRVWCGLALRNAETLWRPTGELVANPELVNDTRGLEDADEITDPGKRGGAVIREGHGDSRSRRGNRR